MDDYANAFNIAAKELRAKDPAEVGRLSGVEYDAEAGRFRLDFLGRPHLVAFPEMSVVPADGRGEAPLPEQVLVLHYLNQARGTPLAGELITYREVPAGEFYYPAFVKRAEAPLVKTFGASPGLLPRLAPEIGGISLAGHGDGAARFPALPRAPVTLIVWGGDDEFEPSGRILFDRSISDYLTTEDVAWLAGLIVYRLMRLASRPNQGE
ncbi:MAG: DUF3786 domain-containing protein [Thermodesulfobacteriota bacterium]